MASDRIGAWSGSSRSPLSSERLCGRCCRPATSRSSPAEIQVARKRRSPFLDGITVELQRRLPRPSGVDRGRWRWSSTAISVASCRSCCRPAEAQQCQRSPCQARRPQIHNRRSGHVLHRVDLPGARTYPRFGRRARCLDRGARAHHHPLGLDAVTSPDDGTDRMGGAVRTRKETHRAVMTTVEHLPPQSPAGYPRTGVAPVTVTAFLQRAQRRVAVARQHPIDRDDCSLAVRHQCRRVLPTSPLLLTAQAMYDLSPCTRFLGHTFALRGVT